MIFSINYKKEFLYIVFLIPLFILKIALQYNLSNKKNNLIFPIESFSKILLIIIYFYQIKTNRINNSNFVFNKKINKNQINFILCSIFFLFIASYLEKFNFKDSKFIYLDTISILLIDLKFFRKQIYSHHILSIVLNLMSFLIIFINYQLFEYLYMLIIIFIKNYCKSFSILLIKYINTIYFTNIYSLGSILGFFSFLFQLFLINFDISQFINLLIVYLIFCYLLDIFFYYIIFKLGPIYALFCYHISELFIIFLTNRTILSLIESLIFFIVEIISYLIYLEIIEFNFFGLNKNTKKNISLRGMTDTLSIIDGNNENQ